MANPVYDRATAPASARPIALQLFDRVYQGKDPFDISMIGSNFAGQIAVAENLRRGAIITQLNRRGRAQDLINQLGYFETSPMTPFSGVPMDYSLESQTFYRNMEWVETLLGEVEDA